MSQSTIDDSKTCSQSSSSTSGLIRSKKSIEEETMNSIQIGVQCTVGAPDLEPDRDLLIQDFMKIKSLTFPTKNQIVNLPQLVPEFKFLNYAPNAFKYFRRLFRIDTDNFLRSICSESLKKLSTSGSSGSSFYVTHDDEFILKTARQKEGNFLLELLPGYFLNLTQNPKTLLPKFFGFYSYSSFNRNVRILVMNNLVPSNITVNQKYDLKGSTAKRKATVNEIKKELPTYKDLDFIEHHPNGLLLDSDTYSALSESLVRDCRVLESFKIIDYSLLLAVYNVDQTSATLPKSGVGIRAKTPNGDNLLLFAGIIDILQSYQFRKKVEHTLKSIIYEKDSISVHRPDFYSQRFQSFILNRVFRPVTRRKTSGAGSATRLPNKLIPQNSLSLPWVTSKKKFSKTQTLFSMSEEKLKINPFRVIMPSVSEKAEEDSKSEPIEVNKTKSKEESAKENEDNEKSLQTESIQQG